MPLVQRYMAIDSSDCRPLDRAVTFTEHLKPPVPCAANVSQGRESSGSMDKRVSNGRGRSKRSPPQHTDLQTFVREFLLHDTSDAGSALRFLIATMMSIKEVTEIEFTDILRTNGCFVRFDRGSDTSKWRDVPLSRVAVEEVARRTVLAPGDSVFASKGKLYLLRDEIRDLLKLGKIGKVSIITEEFRNFATELMDGKAQVPALVMGEDPFERGRYAFLVDDPFWLPARRLMETWCRYLGLVPEKTILSDRLRAQ